MIVVARIIYSLEYTACSTTKYMYLQKPPTERGYHTGALFANMFNYNPGMDKWLHPW